MDDMKWYFICIIACAFAAAGYYSVLSASESNQMQACVSSGQQWINTDDGNQCVSK